MEQALLKTTNSTVSNPLDALVSTFEQEVIPTMLAAHPAANFNWQGNTQELAIEYARALIGTGCTGKNIRDAVDAMRTRSTYEKHPPNAQEFMIMCLHAKGMPTIENCLSEMEYQRKENYGKAKTWAEPLSYWLNAAVSQSRRMLPHSQWLKEVKKHYTELAVKYAKGQLAEIPQLLEHKVQPAYMRYM
ncbi:hypothetical protein [Pseudoalteromonas sp. S16_S37]|uniref:hypothetical protein n=1 Tax=Pseudoalteromonas sp. S16_S37 TaxID=2720228 RepID=UPI00168007C5|nr:hypothetical protein [Pseudoalteromonas sp. S16_S37]MBD1583475.1 hypothetical protein [Pseudoalteromonas sp. S16_S37]